MIETQYNDGMIETQYQNQKSCYNESGVWQGDVQKPGETLMSNNKETLGYSYDSMKHTKTLQNTDVTNSVFFPDTPNNNDVKFCL